MSILYRMERQVTIELLMGRITNDVLYIHGNQDAISHGGEFTNHLLALVKGQL
jgi:hypothetical protein